MSHRDPLNFAIELSEEILAAIAEESWDKVTQLDKKRCAVIDQYFKKTNPQSINGDLTAELKKKNDDIVTRLTQVQHKVRASQLSLNKSQMVSKAYLANT